MTRLARDSLREGFCVLFYQGSRWGGALCCISERVHQRSNLSSDLSNGKVYFWSISNRVRLKSFGIDWEAWFRSPGMPPVDTTLRLNKGPINAAHSAFCSGLRVSESAPAQASEFFNIPSQKIVSLDRLYQICLEKFAQTSPTL